MNAALHYGFNGYTDFSGKSTRSQYWCFAFGMTLGTFVTSIVTSEIFGNFFALLTAIPFLATTVRRMQDFKKRSQFVLVPFYNFILFITRGK